VPCKNSDLSEFTQALKALDFADVEADKFTIFAVSSDAMTNLPARAVFLCDEKSFLEREKELSLQKN